MKNPNYITSPQMQRIQKDVMQCHPFAFIIGDFGEGPILHYSGRRARMNIVSVNLVHSGQHINLSQMSQAPYLIAVTQAKPGHPVLTTIYGRDPRPLFEDTTGDELTGQVLAFGETANGLDRSLAHALLRPRCSRVFTTAGIKGSILMEQHPELCCHLLLCGDIISHLLNQNRKGEKYEDVA